MSDPSKDWEFLNTAWRYALVLTGCREGAAKVFQETADEISRHPHPGDLTRTRFLFYTALRRRALKFPARNELTDLPARFHTLTEPSRSALVLLYLDALSPGEIGRLLELDQRSLGEALDRGRAEAAA